MTNRINLYRFVGLLLLAMLLLAACGGQDATADSSATIAPTKTLFPTYSYVEPTNPPAFNQSAESTEEATEEAELTVVLDPKLVERGLGRYEALECGVCHGVNGEGTADIVGLDQLALAEDAFVTFMRSGGTIGSSHQYSTDRLSTNGASNLYQYLVSLSQGE